MAQVVLCRYDESEDEMNHDFLGSGDTLLYNKGGHIDMSSPGVTVVPLPNVGREVHAYLWHIVHNYHRLPRVTVFSQCRTSDHPHILSRQQYAATDSFRAVVEHRGDGFATCGRTESDVGWGHICWPQGRWRSEFESGRIQMSELGIKEFYLECVDPCLPAPGKCVTLFAGTFSVTRELIRGRPLWYYERLLSVVSRHSQPEVCHFLERLWAYLFLPVHILDQCCGPLTDSE